jgi:hypothetical protein
VHRRSLPSINSPSGSLMLWEKIKTLWGKCFMGSWISPPKVVIRQSQNRKSDEGARTRLEGRKQVI